MKLIFTPLGLAAGLAAGFAAQKGFERLWAVFDDQEAPGPDQRDVPYSKLIPALLIEGAIFRVTKGIVDHGARGAFARLTGSWPGEKSADPA